MIDHAATVHQPPAEIDTESLLEIIGEFLGELALYDHRLPESIRRQLPIVRGDVLRAIVSQPIPALAIPDGNLRLGDGRILVRGKTVDFSATAGREMILHTWLGPKNLTVSASSDLTVHGRLLHAAVSYPGHYPSWRDLRTVRDALFPADLDVAMMLPRAADYINVHPNCFQLWQVPVEWGLR